MKAILLLAAALAVSSCAADQTIRINPEYSEIIEVAATADQIYSLALAWFADSFRSARDVLQLEDADNHRIMGRGTITFQSRGLLGVPTPTLVGLTVEARDGRFRFTAKDFIVEHTFQNIRSENPPTQDEWSRIEPHVEILALSLKSYIEMKITEEEW